MINRADCEDTGWLCTCGAWCENCHCGKCLREAPWGCDCGLINELNQWEEYEEDYWLPDAPADGGPG